MDLVAVPFNWLMNAPWLKVAYSSFLLFLIVLLLAELLSIWTAQKLLVGQFSYFVDGRDDPGRAAAIRSQLRFHHKQFSQRLQKELARRQQEAENADVNSKSGDVASIPDGKSSFGDASSRLSELELTVQGVNLTKLTSTLRNWVTDPDEISGTVSRREKTIEASLSRPKAPERGDGVSLENQNFQIAGALDDSHLAFEIACSVVWSEAAIKGNFARVNRADFCVWADGWSHYFDIRSRNESGFEMSADVKAFLRQIKEQATVLIARKIDFPEMWRLRADVIDLIQDATDDEKRMAIADLSIYRDLLDGKSLGEIESANAVQKNVILSAGYETTRLDHLMTAVRSVGVIRNRQASTEFSGTAFVIAPDTIATASFVVTTDDAGIRDGSLEFVLSEEFGALRKQIFPVKAILGEFHTKGSSEPGITLLKVPGLSAAGIKPLALDSAASSMGAKIVIPGFINGRPGSLMRGAIISAEEQDKLSYNASTGPGTAGAPILDEETLKVVGVHFGSRKDGSPAAFGAAIEAFGPDLFRAIQTNQNH
jgi:hypothetical protein